MSIDYECKEVTGVCERGHAAKAWSVRGSGRERCAKEYSQQGEEGAGAEPVRRPGSQVHNNQLPEYQSNKYPNSIQPRVGRDLPTTRNYRRSLPL
jgi:hypothetical protein